MRNDPGGRRWGPVPRRKVAHAKPWGGREGGLCAWNSEARDGVRGDGWGRGQARRGSWDKRGHRLGVSSSWGEWVA